MLQVPYYTYHIPFNTYWPTRQLHNDSLHKKYTSRLRLTQTPAQNYLFVSFVRKKMSQVYLYAQYDLITGQYKVKSCHLQSIVVMEKSGPNKNTSPVTYTGAVRALYFTLVAS